MDFSNASAVTCKIQIHNPAALFSFFCTLVHHILVSHFHTVFENPTPGN